MTRPCTEKQTLAIMRNFGLKVLTGFRAQLQCSSLTATAEGFRW